MPTGCFFEHDTLFSGMNGGLNHLGKSRLSPVYPGTALQRYRLACCSSRQSRAVPLPDGARGRSGWVRRRRGDEEAAEIKDRARSVQHTGSVCYHGPGAAVAGHSTACEPISTELEVRIPRPELCAQALPAVI